MVSLTRSPFIASLSLFGALVSLFYAVSEFRKSLHATSKPTAERSSHHDQRSDLLRVSSVDPAPLLPNNPSPPAPVASSPRPHNFGTGGIVSSRFDVLASFTRDETLVASYLTSLRGQLNLRYREFFVSRNLSPAQESQLLDILVLYGTRRIEIDVASYATGLTTDPSSHAYLETVRKEYEHGVQQLLGPGGIQEVEAFERREPQRQRVHQLASILSDSHSPLTPDQGALLLNTFKRMSAASASTKSERPSASPEIDEALQEAASYLSEFQVDALRAVLAPQIAANLRSKARQPSQRE